MMHYRIGGLPLTFDGHADADLAAHLPGMGVFADNSVSEEAIRFMLDTDISLPECQWHHRFDLADGHGECRFGTDSEGVYHYTFGGNGVLRYDPRQPETIQCSHLGNGELLLFALWVAYGMVGLRRNVLPVHASTVVKDGRAVLCLGESGTGKSTHTRLWVNHIERAYLLNDDSPIVAVEREGVFVYGSPWSGKTPCFRQERVPIAGFLRLEQRPENSIRRLNTLESFVALQPSCPPSLAHEEHCLDLLTAYLSEIIRQVPVYRMGCLPDKEAALMSHNTLMPTPCS